MPWSLAALTGDVDDSAGYGPAGYGATVGRRYSEIRVTPDTALRHAAVWSCVRLISDTVSSLPVDAYRAGSRKPLATRPQLLDEPAAGTPFGDWVYAVLGSALTRGNTFGLIVDRTGIAALPAQIELVNASRVSTSVGSDGLLTWRLDGHDTDRADLWHLRAYPSAGSPLGLSPIAYAAQSIGLGLAAEAYGAAFFRDGAMPGGVLTHPGTLSQEAQDRLRASWEARHGGRRGTAVLDEGLQFQPIAIAPEESQFLDAQKYSTQQIARIFGVPPEMIGADSGSTMTYSNVEQRSLDFLALCIGPWLSRLERALTALMPRGTYVKFNPGALLKTDLKTRYESYQIALTTGFLTIDEVRDLEDREPLTADHLLMDMMRPNPGLMASPGLKAM